MYNLESPSMKYRFLVGSYLVNISYPLLYFILEVPSSHDASNHAALFEGEKAYQFGIFLYFPGSDSSACHAKDVVSRHFLRRTVRVHRLHYF